MQAPRRAATAMIALAVALAAPASAQTPPATDTIPLSLSETVARAVSQSEEVRLARSQVDLARAQVRGARSAMLTLLVVPVAYTYFDDMGGWFRKRVVSREREKEIERERQEAGLAPAPAWGD